MGRFGAHCGPCCGRGSRRSPGWAAASSLCLKWWARAHLFKGQLLGPVSFPGAIDLKRRAGPGSLVQTYYKAREAGHICRG